MWELQLISVGSTTAPIWREVCLVLFCFFLFSQRNNLGSNLHLKIMPGLRGLIQWSTGSAASVWICKSDSFVLKFPSQPFLNQYAVTEVSLRSQTMLCVVKVDLTLRDDCLHLYSHHCFPAMKTTYAIHFAETFSSDCRCCQFAYT